MQHNQVGLRQGFVEELRRSLSHKLVARPVEAIFANAETRCDFGIDCVGVRLGGERVVEGGVENCDVRDSRQ